MTRLALVALLTLAGCEPGHPPEVLACAKDGVETYRSEPRRCWKAYSGNRWADCGDRTAYRQSAAESCRTEMAP